MRAVSLVTLLLIVACGTSKPPADAAVSPHPTSAPSVPVPIDAPAAEPVAHVPVPPEAPLAELAVDGVTFRRGDRVRSALMPGGSNIGTVKTAESGHRRDLELTPGKTGAILGFQRIENYNDYGFTVELAVVQWDAQKWLEHVRLEDVIEKGRAYTADELAELDQQVLTQGREVSLPSFASTLNIGYLKK